jgi:putative endonuclease
MIKHNQQVGKWGEDQAKLFLIDKGYTILDRNYRTRSGEIDLVASHLEGGEKNLVFVEVKTRTSEIFGYPEQSISRHKWDHLLKAVYEYLVENPDRDQPWRIDIIAVQQISPEKQPEIIHFENVIITDETR